MADVDMFDYILHNAQPPLPKPRASAPVSTPAPQPSSAQERAKREKSLADLRVWWAELPESEKQSIRNKQFPVKEKKKKPEEKPKGKAEPERPKPTQEPYASLEIFRADDRPSKPDIGSYQGPQQWAIAEI